MPSGESQSLCCTLWRLPAASERAFCTGYAAAGKGCGSRLRIPSRLRAVGGAAGIRSTDAGMPVLGVTVQA